jgi:hypothetical protein
VFEAMTEEVAASWRDDYRHELERVFRHDVIVLRAQAIQV